MKPNTKYYPLHLHLKEQPQNTVYEMTFAEIEKIINAPLPASAGKTRAWWANSPNPQSEAWVEAEWVVDSLNLVNRSVVFRPQRISYRVTPIRRRPSWPSDKIKALREHANWTQQELADQMGIRQQTVSEWETGLHKPHFSTGKHLNFIAREVNFPYQVEDKSEK